MIEGTIKAISVLSCTFKMHSCTCKDDVHGAYRQGVSRCWLQGWFAAVTCGFAVSVMVLLDEDVRSEEQGSVVVFQPVLDIRNKVGGGADMT